MKKTHRVCEQQLLHSFEQRISAAGQERRQVCVDLGAQLGALLPTLQLNAGQRKENQSLYTMSETPESLIVTVC